LLEASLAAAPRYPTEGKPALDVLDTVPARIVTGELLADAWLHLECVTDRVVDELGENSLVIGRSSRPRSTSAACAPRTGTTRT
jgi:hypothetical protein